MNAAAVNTADAAGTTLAAAETQKYTTQGLHPR